MKKYTIVYQRERRSALAVKYDRVKTDDIRALLQTEPYRNKVWIVFEDWPAVHQEAIDVGTLRLLVGG